MINSNYSGNLGRSHMRPCHSPGGTGCVLGLAICPRANRYVLGNKGLAASIMARLGRPAYGDSLMAREQPLSCRREEEIGNNKAGRNRYSNRTPGTTIAFSFLHACSFSSILSTDEQHACPTMYPRFRCGLLTLY